jgi:hypothetical protein
LLSEGVASQRLRILLISVRPSTIFVKNL